MMNRHVEVLAPSTILEITMTHCPVIVLTDNLRGWISNRIRRHTKGRYSHVLWAHKPGRGAEQAWRFQEIKISEYLQGGHRVKLWWNPDWTVQDRVLIRNEIDDRLTRRGKYDYLGILGFALGVRWLNYGWREYCSEAAGAILRSVEPEFRQVHPSPADINRWCKDQPQMECLGVFDPDLF
jgi:hypothetical protein